MILEFTRHHSEMDVFTIWQSKVTDKKRKEIGWLNDKTKKVMFKNDIMLTLNELEQVTKFLRH